MIITFSEFEPSDFEPSEIESSEIEPIHSDHGEHHKSNAVDDSDAIVIDDDTIAPSPDIPHEKSIGFDLVGQLTIRDQTEPLKSASAPKTD